MIRAVIKDFSPNRVKMAIHQGTIEIKGPVCELIHQDFRVGSSLFILLGRGQEVLEGNAAE